MKLKLLLTVLMINNIIWANTEAAPPANDDFANAIPLVCGNNYTTSTSEATIDENNAPDGFGADLDAPNIWYSYTGSGNPENITLDLCASGYDTSYLVYTGTSGNLTLVAGNDDNEAQCGAGYRSYGTFESDGTTTYYITITGYGPTSIGDVDLTVSCQAIAPTPNTIQLAIPIVPSPAGTGCPSSGYTFDLDFTNSGTTDSGLGGCLNGDLEGIDQFFTWTATTNGLKYSTPSFVGRAGMIIRNAATQEIIDCSKALDNNSAIFTGWNVGDNLIIQVYKSAGFSGIADARFCLEEKSISDPNNSFPAGAIPITPGAAGSACSTTSNNQTIFFNTDTYTTTDSGINSNCVGEDTGVDQFFTWTATSGGLLWGQNPDNLGIAVRSTSGVEYGCIVRNTGDPVKLSGWEIGEDLIIQIFNYENYHYDSISFCLREYETPTNDLITGAIPIIPGGFEDDCSERTLSFSTDGTTDSGLDGTCDAANTGYDQFFTWTATTNALLWNGIAENPGIIIRDSAGNEITCANTLASNDTILSGWEVGDELIIQIYDWVFIINSGTASVNIEDSYRDISFCLKEYVLQPPALTHVPDDNFEQALIDLGYDDVLDDYVLTGNINTITSLNVSDKDIADLTGIEDFVGLEELRCERNGLTSLNISQNLSLKVLRCGNGPAVADNPNQITSLDVSQHINLEILHCDNNPLNTLDVSQNTNLVNLDCLRTGITDLDVSQNTNLEYLTCGYNNLTSIDISQNTLLKYLYVIYGQLTALDVSNNNQLQYLYAGNNPFSSLDVSGNTDLIMLWVASGQITDLDLSNNASLERLYCSSIPQLRSLNIANGANQNITTFSVFNNPNLTCIQVDDPTYSTTNWTTVGSGTSFSTDCNYSVNDECVDAVNIPISDVSCGNAVTGTIQYATDSNSLHCFGNDANFSDVWFSFVATEETHKITLQNLTGTPNFLWHTVIDAQTYNCSGAATPIICNDGLSGDVTGLTIGNTYYIQVYSHEANANTTFDICVASITVPGETYVPDDNFEQALIDLGYDTVLDNYVTTANINTVEALDVSSKSISDLTGIEDFVALKDLKCESNNLTSLDITQNILLTHVHAYNNALGSIDLTQNTALKQIFLSENQLGEIDVSQNPVLEDLGLFTNPQLSSVDVTANPNLKTLNVSFTQVSVLDVSNNLALTNLSLVNCPVAEIDVTANTALTFLGAAGTLVTSIDVSQNTALETLSCRDNSLLANVNIQNGNNTNISLFFATNTPNLTCVQVDDVAYSIANWTLVDPGINFSTNCPTLIYVPDDNFEQELINLGYDNVLDDYVLESNISTLTSLNISDKNIADLTGIEAFAALEELHVTNNPLGSLDLTQNVALELLNANNTSISTIDLTQNTALQFLSIESNSIAEIDITQNTALISASFQNNQLIAIDVSQNTMLENLNLVQNGQLAALDVSANQNLTSLNLNFTLIAELDLSNNLNLESITAASCPITTIDVSNNLALKSLALVGTPITKVDVSNNPVFNRLYLSNCTDLTGINIQNGNNTNVEFFFTLNTPSLTCVQVDDVAYSTANWMNVDPGINFSIDCGFLENDECVDAISVPISNVLCNNTVSGTLVQSTNSNSFQCFGDSPGFSDVWFSFVATETTHDVKILNTSGSNSRVFHAVIDAQTYNCGNITDAIYCTDGLEERATGLTIGNTYYVQVYTDVENSTETFDICVSTISSPGYTYVPDDNFEQALIDLSLDDVLDNYVLTSNIATVNDLNIRNLTIFDLTGIEDFAALEILNCGLNFLGEVDLSNNTNLNYLIADNAALTGLNVKNGNNTNVTTFITLGNVDLSCIQVDDAAYSTANWTIIEPQTSFNEFCNPIQLGAKVYLQGAMLQNTDGFMRTDLKDNNHVSSASSPYTDGISMSQEVFNATGQDKIVDWIWVELRDTSDATIIIEGKSAALQRDGDIVDATANNTSTPVSFNQEAGDYYIVLKHRNHLGIMSNNTFALSDVVTTVDFTDRNNQISYGTNAQTNFGMPADIVAMWCGNVNGDGLVQYSGTNPDVPAILSRVLNDAGNFLNFPTYIVSGYDTNDVNMDGSTQYTGTNPDTPFILQNILAHPGNFLNFSTYQITEQLPEN